jgi:hypothetical protein
MNIIFIGGSLLNLISFKKLYFLDTPFARLASAVDGAVRAGDNKIPIAKKEVRDARFP